MAIDPATGALVPDTNPGNLSQYGFSGFGGGGLLGNALSNPLFNFGAGLLASSGPSLTPQSGFANVGKALGYASEAQQKALENQLYRQRLFESAKEQQGLARVQDWLKTPEGQSWAQSNPGLAMIAASGMKEGMTGLATALSDPTLAARAAITNADLGTKVAANNQLYSASRDAAEAAQFLKDKGPAGEWLLQHPTWASNLPTGMSVLQALKLDPTQLLGFFPELKGKVSNTKDFADMLSAAATVSANSTRLLANGGLDPSVTSAPADVQIGAYKQGMDTAKTVANSGGKLYGDVTALPPTVFAWRAGAPTETAQTTPPGTVGSQNGALVPQPAASTVISPQPGVPNRTPIPETIAAPVRAAGSAVQSTFDNIFGGPSAGAGAAPAASAPAAPQIKIRGVKTSDFGIGPSGETLPRYPDAKSAEAAWPAAKKQGLKYVIVKDRATGQEYLYGEK